VRNLRITLLRTRGPRGHAECRDQDGKLRHTDDLSVCAGSERCERACVACGLAPVDGHDACIANLPGVTFACCGHGDPAQAYVKFENGVILRRFDAVEYGAAVSTDEAVAF
jgi:hypothetical protein